MEKLKQSVEEKERKARLKYEHFSQKNKNNEFINDLLILKFRFYQYKELVKVFANNFSSQHFQASRYSFYSSLLLPTAMMIGFNLFNPFSVFRRIAVLSTTGGSLISFYFNMKDELTEQAKKDTILGAQIREKFQQLATFDPLVRTFEEESKKFGFKSNNSSK